MQTDRKISVVINTYNAAEHLERVLDSVAAFDEVVVCDMESTDGTPEIARRHGCRVLTFERGEHRICEPARDFAVHSASHPWVLVVDADELVPDALRSYLYDRIADPAFRSALAIPRRNMFLGRYATASPDYQLRFLPRDRTVWPAVIHSRPEIDGPVEDIPRGRQELWLVHLDDAPVASRVAKMNAYTDYEAVRRRERRFGAAAMLWRPVWFFVRTWLLGGGWRDGRRGLVRSLMAASYQITFMAKIYENEVRNP